MSHPTSYACYHVALTTEGGRDLDLYCRVPDDDRAADAAEAAALEEHPGATLDCVERYK